jgi:hypothetical protein
MSWGNVALAAATVVGGYLSSKGGDSSGAYDQAAADEEERRKQIQASQRQIESIFSSPERLQQYADFEEALRQGLFSDLDRQKVDNDRELKFALARSGLAGGSVGIDQNQNLAETYLRGVAEAERKAQRGGAELRAQDQASKQQLFSQLLAGADATTATQNAAQMMLTNVGLAKDEATFGAFDKLFGDFGGFYKNTKEAAGERRARNEFGLNTLFQPRQASNVQVSGGIYPYNG